MSEQQSSGSTQGSAPAQAPAATPSASQPGSGSSTATSSRDQVGVRLAELTGVEYTPIRPDADAGADRPAPEVPADAGQTVQQGSDADQPPQADADAAAAPTDGKSDQPQGDDAFDLFDPFAAQQGKPEAEAKADPDKPEPSAEADDSTKIDKTAPVEQQLKNAESLIGRQGQELGEARKQLQEMANYFQLDGEKVIPRIDKIVEAVPESVVQEYLNSKGLALVPKDQAAMPKEGLNEKYGIPQADLEKIINRMETDEDLKAEEKLALIESDPDRLLDLKLEAREVKKSLAARTQQSQEAKKQKYVDLVKQVQTKVKHFDQLIPSIEKYNGYDYANPDHRFELIYKAAEFDRLKSGMAAQLKKVRDEAIEFGRRQALGLGDMASPGGHVPLHTESGGNGASPSARAATKARFEKAFL